MKILNGNDKIPYGAAVALGAFDGIHIGHMKLIENVVNFAKDNVCESLVFTFDILPSGAKYIAEDKKRADILEKAGVDYLFVQKFDDDFKNLSADEFLNKYLLNVKYISVGFNFRFGKGRGGDVDTLKDFCNKNNKKIDVVDAVCLDNEIVSSTKIRKYIENSDFKTAEEMLGRQFYVEGVVEHGNKIGRTLGFPTANIFVKEGQIMPKAGVYITTAEVDGKIYKAFTNYGSKPTFKDDRIVLETNIFDFDEDLYGKNIKIRFFEKIRDIRLFKNADDLKNQLVEDKNSSLKFFEKNALQI